MFVASRRRFDLLVGLIAQPTSSFCVCVASIQRGSAGLSCGLSAALRDSSMIRCLIRSFSLLRVFCVIVRLLFCVERAVCRSAISSRTSRRTD